jgi:hypothetical protein
VRLLKQSQTAQPLIFTLVSSTDHISALTGASPTVVLSKNGGATASPAGAVTEVGSGIYKVAGNATDTATLGPLMLYATATGADPVHVEYAVVAFDPQITMAIQVAGNSANASALAAVLDYYVNNAVWVNTEADENLNSIWTQGKADFVDAAVTSRLAPTTAGRTLDVSATGEADANIVMVGSVANRVTNAFNVWLDYYLANAAWPSTEGDDSIFLTIPANFANLGINASGHISRVTLVDTATTTTTATNVTTVNGLAAGVVTAASIAANAIGAVNLAADVATELADAEGGISLEELMAAIAGIPVQPRATVQGTHLDITRADAYQNSEGTGRRITFTKTSAETHWPTTLSSVKLTIKPTAAAISRGDATASQKLEDIAGTVVTATGDSQSVYFELTAAQTDDLAAGANIYTYWVKANTATNTATLRSGPCTVRPDQTA